MLISQENGTKPRNVIYILASDASSSLAGTQSEHVEILRMLLNNLYIKIM
jgi:hypothetical protein